mmetsp:Transcript_1697/g.7411  ORF Transcript_1697/g.7411 Transcript_1697/m.7411 type:complete len:208 (+) Transcript_1697:1106-1729(+)
MPLRVHSRRRDPVEELSAGGVLHDDLQEVLRLEHLFHLHHVGVLDPGQRGDLILELLLSMQASLVHQLDGEALTITAPEALANLRVRAAAQHPTQAVVRTHVAGAHPQAADALRDAWHLCPLQRRQGGQPFGYHAGFPTSAGTCGPWPKNSAGTARGARRHPAAVELRPPGRREPWRRASRHCFRLRAAARLVAPPEKFGAEVASST